MKLIIGLGNYGREYEFTRHNIGWLAIDQLSFFEKLIWKNKFKGDYSEISLNGDKNYFLKPHTYMNLSGESAIALIQFFKIPLVDILVVHDELDLPFGVIAFKEGGGTAGHNGLKSLASHLGTTEFNRLRLGIGRPKIGTVSNFVLSPFSSDEEMVLGKYLLESAKAMEIYLSSGFQKAASLYSKKKII